MLLTKPVSDAPRRVPDHLQPDAARGGAPHLDRRHDQRFVHELPPPAQPDLWATDVGLVHFDVLLQQLAAGPDHRATQLVQHRPRRFVSIDPELPLQLKGGQPGRMRRHQVRRPEPLSQRRPRPVQHRPGRDRALVATRLALPETPPWQLERDGVLTAPTLIALGPPARGEVAAARRLIPELRLKLSQRLGKVRARHAQTLRMGSFGVNRISMIEIFGRGQRHGTGSSSLTSWCSRRSR